MTAYVVLRPGEQPLEAVAAGEWFIHAVDAHRRAARKARTEMCSYTVYKLTEVAYHTRFNGRYGEED